MNNLNLYSTEELENELLEICNHYDYYLISQELKERKKIQIQKDHFNSSKIALLVKNNKNQRISQHRLRNHKRIQLRKSRQVFKLDNHIKAGLHVPFYLIKAVRGSNAARAAFSMDYISKKF